MSEWREPVSVAFAFLVFVAGLGFGWWLHRWHQRLERGSKEMRRHLQEKEQRGR